MLDINDPKIREKKDAKAKALKVELTKLKEIVGQTKRSKMPEESAIQLSSEVTQPANARMNIVPSDAAYQLVIESQALIV